MIIKHACITFQRKCFGLSSYYCRKCIVNVKTPFLQSLWEKEVRNVVSISLGSFDYSLSQVLSQCINIISCLELPLNHQSLNWSSLKSSSGSGGGGVHMAAFKKMAAKCGGLYFMFPAPRPRIRYCKSALKLRSDWRVLGVCVRQFFNFRFFTSDALTKNGCSTHSKMGTPAPSARQSERGFKRSLNLGLF